MTVSALGNRYAHALADVVTGGRSATRPDSALAELRAFEGAMKESPELQNVLASPAVPTPRKRAVVGRMAGFLGLSKIVQNFLYVLIDHRRINLLSEIVQSFETNIDERLGFARADVASARELTGEQRAELTAQLERLTGKRIRTRYTVDESLIGGVVARIGSTVYDGSVRGQLQSLGRRLGAEV